MFKREIWDKFTEFPFLKLWNLISGKFQNSRKFQNNAINDAKQIWLSHVIIS